MRLKMKASARGWLSHQYTSGSYMVFAVSYDHEHYYYYLFKF